MDIKSRSDNKRSYLQVSLKYVQQNNYNMKNFTLLFLIIFLFGQKGISQNDDYAPMLGKNSAGWYQYVDMKEISGITTLKTYMDGDTTVNNTTYIRLMSDWYIKDDDASTTTLIGYYREDVEARKVYALNSPSDANQERLVYDFSISPDDTLRLGANTVLVLDSITQDFIVCGEEMSSDFRVFHLTNLNSEEHVIWIEGIGSIAGLQANFYGMDCEKMDEGLVCKMTDDEIVYHYNNFEGFEDCPFDVASSSQKSPEPLSLRLYPNPVHNTLRVTGEPSELGNARYRIYNLTGQEMRRGYLDYSSETSIDVSSFRSGAYIMEIYNQEKHLLANKKFIISN